MGFLKRKKTYIRPNLFLFLEKFGISRSQNFVITGTFRKHNRQPCPGIAFAIKSRQFMAIYAAISGENVRH